jgi:hypothetical protein
MTRVAILDDWQRVARASADWSPLEARAELAFFEEPFESEDEAASALAPFDIILAARNGRRRSRSSIACLRSRCSA